MAAHFEIKRTKAGAMRGIGSVRKNSQDDGRFKRNASGAQHYFNLLAMNQKIIRISERYVTVSALVKGVASAKKTAPEAVVKDA